MGKVPRGILAVISALMVCASTACSSSEKSPVDATSTSGPGTRSARPVLGAWHELVYSTGSDTVLLVNGVPENARSAEPLELWSWAGESWELVVAEPDGPAARNYAAVAYDTSREVLVVHGGMGADGVERGETLEWDGQDWRVVEGPGPGPRNAAAMAYDDARNVAVLYGGDSDGVVRGDTWEWDGSSWTEVARVGPTPPRWPAMFEWDAASGEVVLYGGHQVTDPALPPSLADTWVWADGSWSAVEAESAPGLLVNAGGAFDPVREALVMTGGSDLGAPNGAAWQWAGHAWVEVSADALPERQGHGMAYDASRDVFVVTGGVVTPGEPQRHQDVWEWDGEGRATQRAD